MAKIFSSKTASNLMFIKFFFVFIIFIFFNISLYAQQKNPLKESKSNSQKSSQEASKNVSNISSENQAGTRFSVSGKHIHISCNRSLRDIAKNRLECFGNVYVRRPSELLTSDYAILDLTTEDLHAEGNVVYFLADTVIFGAKMDFNLNTETGIIEDGRVESDKYELLGATLERISIDEFKALDGEYTTCKDCPASWRVTGKTIDITANSYARLSHVFFKISDAPTVYLPYLIFPVKTKRQTGFLFPKMGVSASNGFMFVEPFFWAISRNTDATLGVGTYTLKGRKLEGEFRYVLSERSRGHLNAYHIRDKKFIDPYQDRWALNYLHNLEFPWKIDQKLYWLDASDRDYPRRFPEDIPGDGESALVSTAGLSKTGRNLSVWADAKRIRNLLTPQAVGFDPNTVQLFPRLSTATSDHRLAESFPLHWGLNAQYARFWRGTLGYDAISPQGLPSTTSDLFIPGTTPLRRAQRVTLIPEIYYTSRMFDVLEIVPSVQYRTFYYTFDKNLAPSTTRGYLVAQTEFATTIEHVYGDRVKHKFRPSLIYSNIPLVRQTESHPFNQQLQTGGFQFDEFDIVPISNENQLYFVPLGNSLSYRLGNKFILKSLTLPYTYKKSVEVISGQSINFIEFRNPPGKGKPFSRFFTIATVDTLRVQGGAEYYYYPYHRASIYKLFSNYIFAKYTRRLLAFQRSVGLNYDFNQVTGHTHVIGGSVNWSFNDYLSTQTGLNYQFPMALQSTVHPGVVQSARLGFMFQSPSQCYRVIVLGTWDIPTRWNVRISVPLNLSGEGFMDLTESSTLQSAIGG